MPDPPAGLVACSTPDDYARAVLAAADGEPVVPVLGSADDSALAALAAFCGATVAGAVPRGDGAGAERRLLARAAAGPPGAETGAVVCAGDGFALIGAALALLTGRSFDIQSSIEDVLAAVDRRPPATLTVVAEPERLTTDALMALGGSYGRPPEPLIGVLTGPTPAAASRQLAKVLLYGRAPARRCFAVVDVSSPLPGSEDDVVAWEDFDAGDARRLAGTAFDVVALAGHGDQIDLNLNGAVLCGRPAHVPAHVPGTATHTCLAADHCPRNQEGAVPRLPVATLRCRLLVVESCSATGLDGTVLPASLSLALGALGSVPEGFLATTKVVRPSGATMPLALAMLSSGATFGETARTVSATHSALSGDAPSFLLLGDPTVRLVREDTAAHLRLDGVADPDLIEVDLRGFHGRYARIDVSGDGVLDRPPGGQVSVELVEAEPPAAAGRLTLVGVCDRLGSPVSVLVLADAPVRVSRLRLRVVMRSPADDACRRALAALEREAAVLDEIRRHLAGLGGHRATAGRRKAALELGGIVDAGRELMADGSCALDHAGSGAHGLSSGAVLAGLRRATLALDARVADAWPSWDMPQYQVPLYGRLLRSRGEERLASPCYLCGRTTFEYDYVADVRPDLRRVVTHCPSCDILFDRPAWDPPVEIRGASVVRRGSVLRQEVQPGTATAEPRQCAVGLSVDGALPWFGARIVPRSGSCGPGESVPFDIHVEARTTPGVYELVAVTVAGLSWNVSTKPFMVVEEAWRS